MRQLKLFLLGSPRVEWDGQEVVLALRRGLALLVYLALSDRPHSREELCAILWPDADEREARSRLRRTLHRTSEPFGHPLFDAEGDTVQIARGVEVWLDTRVLERWAPDRQLDPTALQQSRNAADLYRGDLLSGFTLQDSAAWDEWQFLERERFRQLAGRLFHALAETELSAGDWESGLVHARQWLSLDPMHEPAHRLLMKLYASSGQQAAALRQYQQCVRILKNELDVDPEPETVELHRQIRAKRLVADESPRSASHPIVGDEQPQGPHPPDDAAGAGSDRSLGDSANVTLNNLPVGLSHFFGRGDEQARIRELLGSSTVLTLTGPGGIGKTRLAVELATAAARSTGRDVCLVELAPLTDPERVATTVASALGVADATGQPTVETLVRAFRARHLLLVLDNCEHLVNACAYLVEALVRACPGVSVLATSREPLGLSWETVWPVSPLEIPADVEHAGVERIEEVESVQLFVDRARLLRPSFTLGDANAHEVAEICRRLDGIPLAIELAAARLRVLTPRQILERLDDRFRLLTDGARTGPARQQTLVATIDWSHQLLTEPERALFRRLAVFAGGWTLEAAEDVCAGGPLAGGDVLDLLASLVDKSLVTVDVRHAVPRYGFLDTIRAFALERLRESGEEVPTRDRHQAYIFGMLREMSFPLWGPEQGALMAQLDREIDNVRAALDWCTENPESVIEVLEQCTFSLYRYWDVRGLANEARSRLSTLLAQAPADAPRGGIAQTQAFLAHFYMVCGSPQEAHDRALAAVSLARSVDDPWALIQTLLVCTIVHGLLHDFDHIPGLCAEGLKVAQNIGHPFGSSPWKYWLGEVACMEGRLDEGERLLEESQRFVDNTGDSREVSTTKFVRGHAALLRGDLSRAVELIQESLRERFNAADAQVVPHCLDAIAWVFNAQDQPEKAARLLGAAQSVAEQAGVVLLPIWQADRERAASETRARLGDQRFQQLMEEGRALSVSHAIQLALEPAELAR